MDWRPRVTVGDKADTEGQVSCGFLVKKLMETNWQQDMKGKTFLGFLFLFFNPHPRTCSLILEREERRERERERNINVREKHPSVASHMHPDLGIKPAA